MTEISEISSESNISITQKGKRKRTHEEKSSVMWETECYNIHEKKLNF